MDRFLGLRLFVAALLPAAAVCVSGCTTTTTTPVAVETELPQPPEPVALASPVPYRIGITRWRPGPLSDAFARRLREANLFTEVYYPLESGAEMDAAIELDVRREYQRAPTALESFLEVATMGMSGQGGDLTRLKADLHGDLAVRVGERTLRKIETSVQVFVRVQPHASLAAVDKAEEASAGETLAELLVEELCKDPAELAAGIAAGPQGGAP